MIKETLRELIKEQEEYGILVYVQTTSRSMQIIHIDVANNEFIKVVLTNGSTVIINTKYIEYFTIDISPNINNGNIFETSVSHLEDLLNGN